MPTEGDNNGQGHKPWCGDVSIGRPVDKCTCEILPGSRKHTESVLGHLLARDPDAVRRTFANFEKIRPFPHDLFPEGFQPYVGGGLSQLMPIPEFQFKIHSGPHEYAESCLCGYCTVHMCCPGPLSLITAMALGVIIGRPLDEFPEDIRKEAELQCVTHGYKFIAATSTTAFVRSDNGEVQCKTTEAADAPDATDPAADVG